MSASGILTNSRAEAVLQQLLDASQRHELELKSLRSLYDFSNQSRKSNSPQSILLAKLHDVETKLETLSDEVKQVERALKIPGGTNGLTVGDGVAANRKTLARTLNIMAHKSDAEDVKLQAEAQNAAIESMKSSLLADKTCLERINNAVSGLEQRIEAVASEAAEKVDKASIKCIQADAAVIRSRSDFVDSTKESLNNVMRDLSLYSTGLTSSSCKLVELEKHTASEIKALGQRIQDLCFNVDSKVAKKDFDSFVSAWGEDRETFAKIESSIHCMRSRQEEMADRLAYCKQSVDSLINGSVSTEVLNNVVSTFRDELSKRAWCKTVDELCHSLSELVKDYEVVKKKSELAAQFVSWYGNRGDSYEHNLQAVDAHLKHLTTNVEFEGCKHQQ